MVRPVCVGAAWLVLAPLVALAVCVMSVTGSRVATRVRLAGALSASPHWQYGDHYCAVPSPHAPCPPIPWRRVRPVSHLAAIAVSTHAVGWRSGRARARRVPPRPEALSPPPPAWPWLPADTPHDRLPCAQHQFFAAQQTARLIRKALIRLPVFAHLSTYVSTLLSTWTRSLTIQTELRYNGVGRTVTVVRLKDLMIEIDGASQANRSSVAVTAESLSALDEASQMNASMVEQSATATASLKQQAAELQELVAYFRAR